MKKQKNSNTWLFVSLIAFIVVVLLLSDSGLPTGKFLGLSSTGYGRLRDTDGGYVVMLPGTCGSIEVGSSYGYTDRCLSKTILREYYIASPLIGKPVCRSTNFDCSKFSIGSTKFKCSTLRGGYFKGHNVTGGACVQQYV